MTHPEPPRIDLNTLSLPELFHELARSGHVRRLLELTRDEDLGISHTTASPSGDITAIACGSDARAVTAHIVARESGVIAGLEAVPMILEVFHDASDAPCEFRVAHRDGSRIDAGTPLATLSGALDAIVTVERTILNLVGRLSGIATGTAQYVNAIRTGAPGASCRLLGTRKTTPGLRALETYAVRCGGGQCHRLGLYDALLIKDNHIAGMQPTQLSTFVRAAAQRARANRPIRFVMVEVDTLEQFDVILALEPGVVDIVLLDNMPLDDLSRAVVMRTKRNPTLLLEASGGVTLDTVAAIARTGVDRISVGALTHHAASLDVALDIA